jgi:hypothetical protein
MTEFVQTLAGVVAFLLPVGSYCLFLAWINRRPRPVMAGGGWDALGPIFAATGFFVVTIPILLTEFYRRTAGVVDNVRTLWAAYWLLWLVYFGLLIVGCALMIRWRSMKTMIYNVDVELFTKALDQAFAQVGLEAQEINNRLVLKPTAAGSTAFTEVQLAPVATTAVRPHAEMNIETFPSMCHVTLHWIWCDAKLRGEIERELDKTLESAAPLDNPAAGWFLSVSGLILGAVAAIMLAIVLLFFLVRFV